MSEEIKELDSIEKEMLEKSAEGQDNQKKSLEEIAYEDKPEEAAPVIRPSQRGDRANSPQESMSDYESEIRHSMRSIHEGDILSGTVIDVNEEEVIVDLQYYSEGVIRAEDYSDDPTVTAMDEVKLGEEISATVIKRDDGRGRILLSKKAANSILSWDKLRELKESQVNVSVKINEAVKGGVTAFLEGIRGFIPASKLSLNYVEEDEFESYINKTIQVRVFDVDKDSNRLILSAKEIQQEKAAEENARKVSNIEVGLVTEGVVETLKPYGAFVRLSNGVSGLLHISEISTTRIKHPKVVLKEGETIKVKVIAIKDGKISLSKKALEEIAAKEIEEETIDLPESKPLTSSLGDLIAKLNLK